MKIKYLLLAFMLLSASVMRSQQLMLYEVMECPVKDSATILFVSLSGSDESATGQKDTLDLGDVANITKRYFPISRMQRQRFLKRVGMSETDSVFIYDYALNTLLTRSVRDLPMVACLDEYLYPGQLHTTADYMIGFLIDKSLLSSFREKVNGRYSYDVGNTLVNVGKANPFIRGPLKPMIWTEMQPELFPADTITIEDSLSIAKWYNQVTIKAYECKVDSFRFVARDRMYQANVVGRSLQVFNLKTGARIFKHFTLETESISPVHLNTSETEIPQLRMGPLFKGKAPALLWLEWHSFGCMSVYLLDPSGETIPIRCDNRH